MRKFTKYPSNYVKANRDKNDFAYSSKSVLCHYDRIIPVEFMTSYTDEDFTQGHILTGKDVPLEFEIDLEGSQMFNEIHVVAMGGGKPIYVNTLSEVLSFLDSNNIRYKVDEYGLIVGGSEDGRIDDDLNLFWVE